MQYATKATLPDPMGSSQRMVTSRSSYLRQPGAEGKQYCWRYDAPEPHRCLCWEQSSGMFLLAPAMILAPGGRWSDWQQRLHRWQDPCGISPMPSSPRPRPKCWKYFGFTNKHGPKSLTRLRRNSTDDLDTEQSDWTCVPDSRSIYFT